MSDDDPEGGTGSARGETPGDADSWVAQWISLFDEAEAKNADGDAGDGATVAPGTPADPTTGLEDPAGLEDTGVEDTTTRLEDPAGGLESSAGGLENPAGGRPVLAGLDQAMARDVPAEPLFESPILSDRPAEQAPTVPEPGEPADEGDDEPRGPEARNTEARAGGDGDDLAAIEAWQRAQERNRRQARLRANQRAARQMRRQLPDRPPVQVAGAGHSGQPIGGPDTLKRIGLVALALVAVAGFAAYLVVGFGADTDRSTETAVPAGPVALDPTDELGLTVGADVAPATLEQLALSTVQLVGLDDDLQAQCAGTGVIVATDGTIVTNAHVVRSDSECSFTSVGVAVTSDPSSPPELLYRAEVVLLRLGVDLAVLRIAGPLADVEAPWPRTFLPAPLGDSDTVELGDSVRVLGYPVIGGDTITLTTGTVSGFTSQVGLGNRALIKTDASISAGNSGGLAVDAVGRVIGIPTKARASEQGPAVDCRPVSDTNGDGAIDEGDGCVSVGGFLNGIRPINLSLPLLAAAGTSDPILSDDEVPAPAPPVDLTRVDLFNPRFALGVDEDDLPIDEITTAVAGIPQLCFFVDWEGIPAEASTDGSWYLDNEIQTTPAVYSGRIRGEETGQHFWLCIEDDDEDGLDAGVYEIVFYVDRQVYFVEAIELTPAPVDEVAVTWKNETGVELCGLAINPLATSRQIGLDELPDGFSIPPAGEWVTTMPQGSVVVEAYGCDGEPVANQFDGLDIAEPVVLQIES